MSTLFPVPPPGIHREAPASALSPLQLALRLAPILSNLQELCGPGLEETIPRAVGALESDLDALADWLALCGAAAQRGEEKARAAIPTPAPAAPAAVVTPAPAAKAAPWWHEHFTLAEREVINAFRGKRGTGSAGGRIPPAVRQFILLSFKRGATNAQMLERFNLSGPSVGRLRKEFADARIAEIEARNRAAPINQPPAERAAHEPPAGLGEMPAWARE